MSDNVAVSVILPTFNRASDLPRSICSVLCQSYRDFELIIVDDASTDNTEQVVGRFDDNRIRYIKLTNNVGGAEARNVGIRTARGSIIAFQDSDDEWLCDKLRVSVEVLDGEDYVGAVCSSYLKLNDKRCAVMPALNIFSENNVYKSILFKNVVGTPALVVRRTVIESVGGFQSSLPRYQDWELAIRLAQKTKIRFISQPLVIAYTTAGSVSSNKSAHKSAIEYIYQENETTIAEDFVLRAEWYYKLGDAMFQANDSGGRALLFKAFMAKPANVKYIFCATLSVFGPSRFYNFILGFVYRLKGG